MAGIHKRHLEALGGDGVGFHEAVIDEIRNGCHAGAGKFRQIAVVVVAAPGFIGPRKGISDKRRNTRQLAGQSRQATDAERIEPPQRVHQGNDDEGCSYHRPAQIGENRKQERRGIAVDHHQIDEVRGHLHDIVLEPRQQDQHHDESERQCARQGGTPQQRDPEEVQDPPRQQEACARPEIGFGLEHDGQRRQMRGRDGKQTPDSDRAQASGGDSSGWTWIRRGRHGLGRNLTRRCLWALAGVDQKTDDASGICGVS